MKCDVIVWVSDETLKEDFLSLYSLGTDFEIIERDQAKAMSKVRVYNEDILTIRKDK